MSEYAPRCPFCAHVLKLQPSFWERIGLKSSKIRCPSCQRACDGRDAHTMGSAYWHWAELFRKELSGLLEALPVLPEPAMHRALGMPNKEDTRLIPSFDELVRTCLRHHRQVLIEMARGREAMLEAVHLMNDQNAPELVAILGTTAVESGERDQEQLIARAGHSHYVLYNYPVSAGAEARVKRAIHNKEKKPRSLTDVHVAAMRAEPHAATVHRQ
jgi:hypothetical protein